MNSYNDNLHSVVSGSLLTQEIANKQLNSQRIASMFTLFHAQAATITANEKLTYDKSVRHNDDLIQEQAVQNSNLSVNLLASATQASSYVAQSVTNTSVAAANMQIAGNAILKLAGDIGNIYSTVNAADYGTDIYDLGKESYELINQTAYLAEVATQTAMEASMRAAEVVAPAVLTKAKNANGQMANVLQIASSNYTAVSQVVATDVVNVAAASVAEQAAEGDYEDIVADYKAARKAKKSMNDKLNLALTTQPLHFNQLSDIVLSPIDMAKATTTRKIEFNLISSPFPIDRSKYMKDHGIGPVTVADAYPVSSYYLMVVPDDNKTIFALADAESVVMKGGNNFIPIDVTPPQIIADPKSSLIKQYVESTLTCNITDINPSIHGNKASVTINFFDIKGGRFQDVLGKQMTMGTKYVIFVVAIYSDSYKRKLNNFEDFLSAFSPTFKMTQKLVHATQVTVGESSNTEESNKVKQDPAAPATPILAIPFNATFNISEHPNVVGKVEYRSLIVPTKPEVISGLLTRSSLNDLEHEVTAYQEIADKYDPEIAKYQGYISVLQLKAEQLGSTLPYEPITKIEEAGKIGGKISKKEEDPNENTLFHLTVEYEENLKKLTDAQNAKLSATDKIASVASDNFDFFLNQKLADAITADNYTVAAPTHLDSKNKKESKDKNKPKRTALDVDPASDPSTVNYTATFQAQTTDCFGDVLVDGKTYTLIVLSCYNGPEENAVQFENNWTGEAKAELVQFTYSDPANVVPTKTK